MFIWHFWDLSGFKKTKKSSLVLFRLNKVVQGAWCDVYDPLKKVKENIFINTSRVYINSWFSMTTGDDLTLINKYTLTTEFFSQLTCTYIIHTLLRISTKNTNIVLVHWWLLKPNLISVSSQLHSMVYTRPVCSGELSFDKAPGDAGIRMTDTVTVLLFHTFCLPAAASEQLTEDTKHNGRWMMAIYCGWMGQKAYRWLSLIEDEVTPFILYQWQSVCFLSV